MNRLIFTMIALAFFSTIGFSQSKSEFDRDIRVQEFQKKVFSLNNVKPEETDKIYEIVGEIKRQGDALVAYYGIDKINSFVDENIKIENNAKFAGDKCHRNANGTVNSDACSFWENVSVSFQSYIGCPSPPVGAPNSWYDAQLNCIQKIICKSC